MKKLTIQGQEFEYKVHYAGDYDNGTWEYTDFYQGTVIKECRKYFLFGKIISTEVPKCVFTLNIDIENPTYSKEDIRKKIEEKLTILTREKQIERGEIV